MEIHGSACNDLDKMDQELSCNKQDKREMPHRSNYACLEVKEIQKHCSIIKKQIAEIDEFLTSLYDKILQIPKASPKQLSQFSWLAQKHLHCPYLSDDIDADFCWFPPRDIKLLGSYQLGMAIKQALNVDLMLEMPKECVFRKDCFNEKYLLRKNFYLTYVAYHLSNNSDQYTIDYCYFLEDPLKLVILLTPTGSLSNLSVKIHARPPVDFMDERRLAPDRSNISKILMKNFVASDTKPIQKYATSHYNNSILMDINMELHLNFLHQLTKDNQSIKDAVKFLKLWLIKRQLNEGYGGFSGFVMSMYVALLLYTNKINRHMSSFQIVRNVFKHLGSSKWSKVGDCFDSVSDINLFHKHFDVVFLGPSGKVNLCANMSTFLYEQVLYEANTTFTLLNQKKIGIAALFMEPVPFPLKFDTILHFVNVKDFQSSFTALQEGQVSRYGNCIGSTLSAMSSVLKTGLGERVHLIGLLPPRYKSVKACYMTSTSSGKWKLDEAAPHWYDVASSLSLGLVVNCDKVDETLIKGPSAESAQAAEFRDFWGDLSDLRRFKDGSICEAVYFECDDWTQSKNVHVRICQHLLQRHFNISPSDVISMSSQLEVMLQQEDGSLGQENGVKLRIVFQELCQELISMKELPLSITNVHGLSPALRSTEVFLPSPSCDEQHGVAMLRENISVLIPVPDQKFPPYTQPIQVLCFFESSGKWPEDSDAIQRLKAAFNNAICTKLQSRGVPAYASPKCVYLYKKNILFQLQVGYQRETAVLQSYKNETGLRKKSENLQSITLEKEIVHRPQIAARLEGISKNYLAFGNTCRLAKRWLSSHLFINHICDEAVELLCCYVFAEPAPFESPNSPRVGFMRFLRLLSTFNFDSTPIIINFENTLTEKERSSMQTYFNSHRQILPAMCIMTSLNPKQSLWSEEGPARVVVQRMKAVAKTSLQYLQSRFMSGEVNIEPAFTPSLEVFDLVIYLKNVNSSSRPNPDDKKAEVATDVLPIVGFDPVEIYLNQLEACYGEFAIFFHDRYNKSPIAACWRPNATQPSDEKTFALHCKTVDDDGKLATNVDAIIDDFRVLGAGLVDFIELRTNKWTV